MMKVKRAFAALLICLLLIGMDHAKAQSRFYVFPAENPPEELRITADEVAAGDTVISMTFAGDCTLGGETAIQASRHGFQSVVAEKGMDYPFAKLKQLFAADDFTVVNLEGVLSQSKEDRVKKQYNYIGDTAYTDILSAGSIECVNLANNHVQDYGQRGYIDTKDALDAAGIAHFDADTLCIFEKDGVRIGMTATLWYSNEEKLHAQMALLRELGCSAIVHTMHQGEEYAKAHIASQRTIAEIAISAGAALVVGHHPHVVQDVEVLDGVPIIYSLGNCCFGGNTDPHDYDALLLGAEFTFSDGELQGLDWTLHPIAQSGDRQRNNFQPVILMGDEAQRVIDKVQSVSSFELLPFKEGEGARQESIAYD